MSSRSTSPAPALSAKGGAAIGPGGGGGTLSNDALYAPLSAYADPSTSTSTSTSGAPPGKKKGGHSLSLQTSSSLRESALLAFLTSTAQSLKTAHPQECSIYRSIGGSISQHGMGDGDRAGGGIRNVLEGKLSNRSLVLVGGGVHTHPSASNALSRSGEDVGLVGMGAQAAAGGKRARRRAGGNGLFGCISNKRRKKLLKQMREEQSKNRSGEAALPKSVNTSEDVQQKTSNVIATLHEMWTEYMQQLLKATASPPSDADSASSSPEVRRKMAHALATAEHVGMPATIVDCPSRRHLVDARCVVVNETKETWKVAMLARKRRKRANGEVTTKGDGGANETKGNAGNEATDEKMPPPSWKIVLVPKLGTVLDITLPPVGADTKNTSVTVRLET